MSVFFTSYVLGETEFPLSGVKITKNDKGIIVDSDWWPCPLLRWVIREKGRKLDE